MFSPKAASPLKGGGRYTLADGGQPTAEGGTVAVGIDRREQSYLVHVIGRATEAIALHAVATAVAGGQVIPFADLLSAIRETGQLPAFLKAVEKAQA